MFWKRQDPTIKIMKGCSIFIFTNFCIQRNWFKIPLSSFSFQQVRNQSKGHIMIANYNYSKCSSHGCQFKQKAWYTWSFETNTTVLNAVDSLTYWKCLLPKRKSTLPPMMAVRCESYVLPIPERRTLYTISIMVYHGPNHSRDKR